MKYEVLQIIGSIIIIQGIVGVFRAFAHSGELFFKFNLFGPDQVALRLTASIIVLVLGAGLVSWAYSKSKQAK